ncbi:hypothetical protein [Sphingomonas panaciterrae]|uniref:hypothetical protein n=1 Tax=Sphingomonas panaciterrae TaxID=1462999 RepID=UPI003A8E6FA9
MSDEVRKRLALLSLKNNTSLSELSRLIGRNVAYLQQFIERGTPRVLAEKDRRILAEVLGVSEVELGGPAPAPAAEPIDIEDPRLIDEVAAAMWASGGHEIEWEVAFHWQDAFRRNAAAALLHLKSKGHL